MLDLLLGIVVVSGLTAWFLASIVFQYRDGRLLALLERLDRYCLLPRWTFFAPFPFNRDFELLYRDRHDRGPPETWHLVAMPQLSFRNVLWNPSKRSQKALIDLCDRITRSLLGGGSDITESRNYRALERYVCGIDRAGARCERQFMIVFSDGYRASGTRQIVLISPFRGVDEYD